jgi:hypothetical protein
MGLLFSVVSACLDDQVCTGAAAKSRLVVPASVLGVRVVADVVDAVGLGARAVLSACSTWNVELDAAVDERAPIGVLGTGRHVAIDGAEIVP